MAAQRQANGSAAKGGKQPRARSERARSAGVLVLAVVAVLFAILNTGKVEVNWIIGAGKAPLIIVIVISLLVGIVITHFAERRSRRRD